jgi:Asp-tRNA(Asn)/Glu-tRNA(Gln) amidotransferase A subunit family amidase
MEGVMIMDKTIIELLARRAGLDKALAQFPEDVAAAARQASDSMAKTVAEAAGAIAARKLSPVELMKTLLDRIGRFDPKLNVFIRLDGNAGMDAARAAEAEIASGRQRGPLHGVPVGIKDIIDVGGLPTTCHSKLLIDNIASTDAVCVSRLRGRRYRAG